MVTETYPSRPDVLERQVYQPQSPQEAFIVPLVKHHVEQALAICGPASTPVACVLDVGCGRQPFRSLLEGMGYTYLSLDAQQNPEGTVDVVGDIDRPLPTQLTRAQPFDLIFCTEVMEHVANWTMAFDNFAQLLPPGGRLLITCPFFYPLHEEPYDFWRPTVHALHYFGRQSGFKVLHQVQAGDGWDILGTLISACSNAPVRATWGDRLLSRLVTHGRNLLFRLLVSQRLQTSVRLVGPFYQANVMVFEKL
ncbi:class I SAM-dependent methyltransferase [Leptolyngbya sp. 'hensonii']|uniref:class I SAM-dependent methyltransferase n=1 Tax=Leptolyngbya sp. 'hensonii' TaxID=1922337 RepID=UPI00155909F4|nr:class I SAM-dependent methyltransferase [Leptolyngbya sp. 'hensonii']